MSVPEVIPRDIIRVLFRGLVWCGDQITPEEREAAWAWLEARNRHEDMNP